MTRRSTASTVVTDREWGVLAPLSLGRPLAASITVHSTIVPAGGLLTFTASGFAPQKALRVRLDDGRAPLAELALDSDGRTPENSRVRVPVATQPGAHLLTFEDGTSDFDLLIRTTASTAAVTVEPATVIPGGRVRFAGRSFPPGRIVHVKLDATGEPLMFPIDADGTIAGSLPIDPTAPPGLHELRFLASDPATSAAVAITVTEPD